MENRDEIVQELFELRIYLNRRNISADIKTNLVFQIRSGKTDEFGCYLHGVTQPYFLTLCRKHRQKLWHPSLRTKFAFLEDYCFKFLNENNSNLELLIKSLRSLGLF